MCSSLFKLRNLHSRNDIMEYKEEKWFIPNVCTLALLPKQRLQVSSYEACVY